MSEQTFDLESAIVMYRSETAPLRQLLIMLRDAYGKAERAAEQARDAEELHKWDQHFEMGGSVVRECETASALLLSVAENLEEAGRRLANRVEGAAGLLD